MIKGYVRYCDRCGVELTKANNTCGFELCDKCNEALEQQLAIKNDSSELEKNSKKLEKDFGEWDCISRERMKQIVFNITAEYNTETIHIDRLIDEIDNLPSVTPQEPRCKECKWWKDSDGEYRRGCRAESQCPINTHAVYYGEGYCYMFSPKAESESQESEEV